MGIIGTILGANPAVQAGQGLATAVTDILDKIGITPGAKAEVQQKLAENAASMAKMEQDYDAKLQDIAGQNIRSESTSSDKYTSRARPTFMYIVEAALAMNFVIIPVFMVFSKLLNGPDIAPIALPADVLTLFGVCITGYVAARTADKALALPGETSISVLGVKASNKQQG